MWGLVVGGKAPFMLVMVDQMENDVMLVLVNIDEMPVGRRDGLTLLLLLTFSDKM